LLNADKAEEITKINSIVYSPLLEITNIDPTFFTFNLAIPPSQAPEWYYYLIPVVTAALQFVQAQYLPMAQPQPKKKDDGKEKDGDKKPSTSEDFQRALSMQMRYFFPLMLGWLSYTLPLGLSLYWNIFSIFSIFQHRSMRAAKEQRKQEKKEQKAVEELTEVSDSDDETKELPAEPAAPKKKSQQKSAKKEKKKTKKKKK
jgi:YidC/Oxa1 family membrane protein insertase